MSWSTVIVKMSDKSTNLKLPFIQSAQAQKHVTHNDAITNLDILTQLTVEDKDLSTPPPSPIEGTCYIIASTATAEWAGKENQLAAWQDGAWRFYEPAEGWVAWIRDEDTQAVFDGALWNELSSSGGGGSTNLNPATGDLLGVNATADTTNRLSVNSDAVLLNRETDNIEVTLNKETQTDEALLNYKTSFSTRATIGLIGNDDLSLKVTPDGNNFHTGLTIHNDTGNVAIGTSSDANNKFIVSGQNTLFTNSGPLNLVMNKGSSSDDLSFTFQTNFTSRALIGLLSNDNLTFKVSSDGVSYSEGITIDNSGAVAHPESSKFSSYVNYDKYIPANSWSSMSTNNARHNNQGDWSAGIFTAPSDGYYQFGAGFRFKINGTVPTDIRIGIGINGNNPTDDRAITNGDATIITEQSSVQITVLLNLSAGDTVQPLVYMTTNDGYVEKDNNFFWGCRLA
jgi:hypothetical protein